MSQISAGRRSILQMGIGGVGLALIGAATSQAKEVWPTGKPIKIIIPAQPGGGLDLIARTMADKLSQAMGTPFIAENMGGGGGTIASLTTARAAPDGQTFMIVNISTHGTNPAIRNLPYDTMKDFTHVGMVGGSPNVLVVGPELSKANSMESLLAELKKRGKPATYGSAGPGTSSHLLVEQLSVATGIPFLHVPYRGIGPAMVDVMAGRTDMAFPGLIAALQFIKASRLKALAVSSQLRMPQIPTVSTFAELGMSEFSSLQWYGISGPAGIPAHIVNTLNVQMNKVLKDPQVVSKFEAETLTVMPMTPQQFTAFIDKDASKWKKLVKDRGIEVDAT
ncbi:Bug family tripartite tricarboxylate transporter substrate binding protein [Polynucleobacter tropicus]|nr:tripartite tricarboxylate transporter substrate binding protein [Polynucleobacter tropicus]